MLLLDTLTRIREAPGDRIEVPSAGWGEAKLVDKPLARRSGVNFTGRQIAWQRGAGSVCNPAQQTVRKFRRRPCPWRWAVMVTPL